MNQRLYVLLAASFLGAALAMGACGGDSLPSDTQSTATSSSTTTGDTTTTATSSSSSGGGAGGSGGTGGAGGAGGAPDCSTNPMTHVEIINACTTADQVDKVSNLPLLGPNGELPPLP